MNNKTYYTLIVRIRTASLIAGAAFVPSRNAPVSR
jgi:hypothetical protein